MLSVFTVQAGDFALCLPRWTSLIVAYIPCFLRSLRVVCPCSNTLRLLKEELLVAVSVKESPTRTAEQLLSELKTEKTVNVERESQGMLRMRTETELQTWNHVNEIEKNRADRALMDLTAAELQSLLRNIDRTQLVAPLREAQASDDASLLQSGEKQRAALALQERWNSWLVEREVLREEIKRGKECFEQVQEDLAATRASLEDWARYERQCGKNPLFSSTQSLDARERVEQFLPGWLSRREEQLRILTHEMQLFAREHGMEHLL